MLAPPSCARGQPFGLDAGGCESKTGCLPVDEHLPCPVWWSEGGGVLQLQVPEGVSEVAERHVAAVPEA